VTSQNIIDVLAYARDTDDQPGLTTDALYDRVAPTLWGHAPMAEALRQGFMGDNATLAELGRRPYFDQVLNEMLARGDVVREPDLTICLPNLEPSANRRSYEPGSGKRAAARLNLSRVATDLFNSGLDKLFPPMGPRQFDELVTSMRVEGYDPSKPVVRDSVTGIILDGRQRERAAHEAGVSAKYIDVECADDIERVRYAIRGNMLRRGDLPESLERKLRQLQLTTRELAKLVGNRLATGVEAAEPRRRQSLRYTDDDKETAYYIVANGGSVKDAQQFLTNKYGRFIKNSSAWTVVHNYALRHGLPQLLRRRDRLDANGIE
jgi:hypothetical protein